jgi:hypothetical protein
MTLEYIYLAGDRVDGEDLVSILITLPAPYLRGFSWQTGELIASQEDLCSMWLGSYKFWDSVICMGLLIAVPLSQFWQAIIFMCPRLMRIAAHTRTHTHTHDGIITQKINILPPQQTKFYKGADKSLARPGRKQATATDFDVHISYL